MICTDVKVSSDFRYRKVSGDSCSGGDVEARLDGEMLPCPVEGTVRSSSSAYSIIFVM